MKRDDDGLQVSVIIPAFNEEGFIGETVSSLKELKEVYEVIVVDDGSVDKTAVEAWNNGAVVRRFSWNRGKSQAMRDGVFISRRNILAFIDADLGATAVVVRKLMEPVIAGRADMSVGCLKNKKSVGGIGLVKKAAYWGIYYFTGRKMLAPLSGQRVLRRSLWDNLNFEGKGFAAEVSLTIETLQKGFQLVEVPLEFSHRFTCNDTAGFMHRGLQFFEITSFLFDLGREKFIKGKRLLG